MFGSALQSQPAGPGEARLTDTKRTAAQRWPFLASFDVRVGPRALAGTCDTDSRARRQMPAPILHRDRDGSRWRAANVTRQCGVHAGCGGIASRRLSGPSDFKLGHGEYVRYITRPPIAQERFTQRPDGTLLLEFKKVWKDGSRALVLAPEALLVRLCTAVPPPRFHMVRYFGVLSSHSAFRSRVVPEPPEDTTAHRPSPAQGDQLELLG